MKEKAGVNATESSSRTSSAVIYGELTVLGYNAKQPDSMAAAAATNRRQSTKFSLRQRSRANGVRPSREHECKSEEAKIAMKSRLESEGTHSVSYTLSRNHTIVVEYTHDPDTDLLQIGRSAEEPIDFMVLDTIPGNERHLKRSVERSTISRFACRILISRKPPFTARIFAAGFDSKRNIFLGEKATKWKNKLGDIDGLTTNGVLIMHPTETPEGSRRPSEWKEVSVCGAVFPFKGQRECPKLYDELLMEDNILQDGTLIDLCGVTLLWRSAEGLEQSTTTKQLEFELANLNAQRPQCPVGLTTLVIPARQPVRSDKQPYVYVNCGHVQGDHHWGVVPGSDGGDWRECPMCRAVGPLVELCLGAEPSVYVDSDPKLTHAFVPCGHVASVETVRYWSQVCIPLSSREFRSICPFCATPLDSGRPLVRLIFQDAID